MRRRICPFVFMLSLLCVGAASLALAVEQPGVTSYLQLALDDAAYPHRDADGRLAVWVYFRDKGLEGSALTRALDRAETALCDRAARRRAKMAASKGERLVDVTDLPLYRPYVDAVADLGAAPRRESRWLNAASFDATPAQIAAIAELPQVLKVDLVNRFHRDDPEPTPAEIAAREAHNAELRAGKAAAWSIDYGGTLSEAVQVNIPPLHDEGVTGEGVLIGMLDGGFRVTHNVFAGLTLVDAWDFVNDDGVVDNETGDPSDSNDHGTKTLSTIMGYEAGQHVGPAFGASVVLAKTEDVSQEVEIEEDNWVAGIEWLDTYGIDVASSSLGYMDWFTFADMDGNTAACTIAADLAVGKGIVVVNSAGNERGTSWDHIIAPADGDSVIAVGAVTSDGGYSYFSSPGPSYDGRIKPDICARGSGNHVASSTSNSDYTTASGTSFSCPLSAGVAALVLSRTPSLTPMQVREALRMTASQADDPDNDYGWGILDAYAAAHYYGASIVHDSLGDTEDVTGPYTVSCTITDRVPLDPGELSLYWRVSGAPGFTETALTSLGGDDYAADIPGHPAETDLEYFISASDSQGIVTTLPADTSSELFGFHVGPDVTSPELVHAALGDQPLITWPPEVAAAASDNLGLASVVVSWSLNGVPVGEFALVDQGGDLYAAAFPMPVGDVHLGDEIVYSITATDAAAFPNETTVGPHAFTVIDALGVVLVIDDSADKGGESKLGADKRLLPAPTASKAAAADLTRWLEESGYVLTVVDGTDLQASDFVGMQLVVLSCGANSEPVESAILRGLVRDWVLGGGKLIVEGGEVAYDALSSPGYADFAADVLHLDDWRSDSAGDLQIVSGQGAHPLLTTPNVLPSVLALTYSAYGDEDAADPAADAYVVYETASYSGAGGVIVYDDNPAPQSAQVIDFCFNLSALDDSLSARALVENAAAYLMADEGGAAASFSGTVSSLTGDVAFPLEGATVDLGGGTEAITDAQGEFLIEDLYAGTYHAAIYRSGYTTVLDTIEIAESEAAYGDYSLTPTQIYTYESTAAVPIPDEDETGITSVITVDASSDLSDVQVSIDLTHTWRGDLIVELTSPAGTTVRLHNRTGSSADDIVGTYGDDLVPDGPGDLLDFVGESPVGDWTLFVSDNVGSDTGTLNSWGLILTLPDETTGIGDAPQVTRLLGNAPNPFNPRTEIRFELARDAAATLAIFDLRGREVRRLLDGETLPAGRHAATWDGRDGSGRAVSSGLYLYRFSAGGAVQERKMLLAR